MEYFTPKKECGLRNTKGTAKTDLVSRGSVMYWPEAPALGQFRTRAFICELPAYPWPKGWTHLLWKQIIVFLTRLSKGSGIFEPQKVDCFCDAGKSPELSGGQGQQYPVCLLSILAAFGTIFILHASHMFARTQRLLRLRDVLDIHLSSYEQRLPWRMHVPHPSLHLHALLWDLTFSCISPPYLPQSTLLVFPIILLYQSKIYTHIYFKGSSRKTVLLLSVLLANRRVSVYRIRNLCPTWASLQISGFLPEGKKGKTNWPSLTPPSLFPNLEGLWSGPTEWWAEKASLHPCLEPNVHQRSRGWCREQWNMSYGAFARHLSLQSRNQPCLQSSLNIFKPTETSHLWCSGPWLWVLQFLRHEDMT